MCDSMSTDIKKTTQSSGLNGKPIVMSSSLDKWKAPCVTTLDEIDFNNSGL